MGLEVSTTIAGLVETNPTASDQRSEGDDHLRLIKSALKNDALAVSTIAAATAKATPVDADTFGYIDSVSGLLRKLSFANLKTTLGSTFAALSGATFTGATLHTTIQASGNVGVGVAPISYIGFRNGASLSGNPSHHGQYIAPTFGVDCTGSGHGVYVYPTTAAGSAMTNVMGIRPVGFVLGGGSAVANYYAIYADAEGNATNNYGAYIADNSGFGTMPYSSVKLSVRGVSTTSADFAFSAYDSGNATLLYLRNDGLMMTGTRAGSPYNYTTAAAANMYVTSGGLVMRSTSSGRFKTAVETMADSYADKLIFQSRPVFYRSTCEADNPAHSYWGLIAEELALIDPRVVQWGKPMHTVIKDVEKEEFVLDADGNKTYDVDGNAIKKTIIEKVEVTETNQDAELIPDGVAYERMVVPLINVVQRQQKAIAALEARLAAAGIA